MTGTIKQFDVLDAAGEPIDGASVEVRDQDTNSLVTIWSNRATTTTKTNPTTSDSSGYAFFYRTGGRYKITVTSGAYTKTFENVPLGTSQEYDVGTSAGTLVLYENFASVAFDGLYSSLTGTPTLGTIATYDAGTASGEIRTNSQNDTRFLKVANNLNDVTASSARANLDLANIYSLEGVVTNGAVPLKSAGAFIDSPLTFDGNDAAAFSADVSVADTLAVGATSAVNGELQVGDGTGSENIALYCLNTGFGRIRFSKGTTGSDVFHGAIVYDFTNDTLSFGTNGGTIALQLQSDQDVDIPAGALTVNSGVTVASGQTQLANYLESTYTATLTCGTSGTITLNSSFDTLSYTRIGNTVHVRGYIEVSSISSPLGDLRLNIPITSANPAESSGRAVGSIVLTNSSTKTANDFIAFVDEGASYASIILIDGSSIALTAASEVTASTTIFVGFSYQV